MPLRIGSIDACGEKGILMAPTASPGSAAGGLNLRKAVENIAARYTGSSGLCMEVEEPWERADSVT
jgi:hypothetical protein